jgi:hypothetical protein
VPRLKMRGAISLLHHTPSCRGVSLSIAYIFMA